jgi:small subunit ribosomal protein S20
LAIGSVDKKTIKKIFFAPIFEFRRKVLPLPAQIERGLFILANSGNSDINMAHHKSALKRIRQNEKRRLQNRYYKKTARTAIKNLRDLKDKAEAESFLPKVISMIDRLAKKGNIHRNKAANLKSGLTRHVNAIA